MKRRILFVLFLFSMATLAFTGVYKSNVQASYYAEKFHGRKTASGEIFNMYDMTCAHKTLPFGTVLRVTNLKNNKTVLVWVNDRGPFVKDREIDVSKAAAEKLDMIKTGTANVRIEIVSNDRIEKPLAEVEVEVDKSRGQEMNALWDVQVGSFSKYENADELAQSLLRKGFENVYFQKTSSVVRVVLKRIPDSELKSVESRLRANGYTDFLVKKK